MKKTRNMIAAGFLGLCVVCGHAAAQDTGKFIYDDHGKRDPFWSLISAGGAFIAYDNDLTIGDMLLEGILVDQSGNNIAIINGQIVKAHDQLGPFRVVEITSDTVMLDKDGDQHTLRINKGD
jgi:hypothetical protein